MHTIPDTFQNAEAPTRPAARVSEPLLILAHRVDRLAELALERLRTQPIDDDSIAQACVDLVQIQALAAGVLR